jgi:hypothetical protein
MTSNQTVVFVESLTRRATAMGWNTGSKQITTFTNRSGKAVDIIKEYGQIDEVTLKTACEHFCKAGEGDAESRAKQNNIMLAVCLGKSLTAEAQARLLTYRSKYTFDGVEYAPLMYKIIMRLATIDTHATTQVLRDNLNNLRVFAATVNGGIIKIGIPQYAKVVVYILNTLNMAATQQHQLTALQGLVSALQVQALAVQSNHMMQKCTCNSLTTALDHIILLCLVIIIYLSLMLPMSFSEISSCCCVLHDLRLLRHLQALPRCCHHPRKKKFKSPQSLRLREPVREVYIVPASNAALPSQPSSEQVD